MTAEIKDRPRTLRCACCGRETIGRPWWNQDTGWGVCGTCADWIESQDGPATLADCYGRRGVHFAIREAPEKSDEGKTRP